MMRDPRKINLQRTLLQIMKQAICIGMVVIVLLPILLTLFAALKTKGDMVTSSPLMLPNIPVSSERAFSSFMAVSARSSPVWNISRTAAAFCPAISAVSRAVGVHSGGN